ncbi:MAG: hypothetical protein GVY17_11080 [Cyanobacteria bacterium]|jgi:hypothetical protein|nr:hypothetical protein [Cyanobacteria bacterium GSL.Bin21]
MLNLTKYSTLALCGGISSLALLGLGQPASAQNSDCQKEIILSSVKVLNGQGVGEGKLEMEITGEIGNLQQRSVEAWKVKNGETRDLDGTFTPLMIPQNSSLNIPLETSVIEEEVGADFAVGKNDEGTTESTLTLKCGVSRQLDENVVIYGKNNARVRVTYNIKDANLTQTNQQALSSGHTVVIDSKNKPGATQYTLNGSGPIQQVEGKVAGRSVTIQNNDQVSGNTAQGRVSSGADGFYVTGNVPEIQLDHPNAATVYVDGEKYSQTQQETIKLTRLSAEARWESGRLVSANNATNTSDLPWQGSPSDDRGFVRLDEVTLENGQTTTALRTHPKWVANGTIKGWHPWVELPPNAVFSADVGFVQGARNTDGVTFQVWEHHKEGGRTVWNKVAEVEKDYTGNLQQIKADLSHLAGQKVKIELRVDAGESSGQDWAAWKNVTIASASN